MITKDEIVYWCRVIPSHNVFDLQELKIRTVGDTWFCGYDKKEQQAYLFSVKDIGHIIFKDRAEALEYIITVENRYKSED